MKSSSFLLTVTALVAFGISPSLAGDRYREKPPVSVSSSLSSPWLVQLGMQQKRKSLPRLAPRGDAGVQVQPTRRRDYARPTGIFALFLSDPEPQPRAEQRVRRRPVQPDVATIAPVGVQTAAMVAPDQDEIHPRMDPKFLPQEVDYDGIGAPGNIVIDSRNKFLYLVGKNGRARRYGVGVGKEGFGWTGSEKIVRKAEWPEWHPPAEMIEREAAKGRILPVQMDGGPANPLGARAMYLGDTLYRIHGTNAPWTIGTNVSSGCIRLRNEDVIDLYNRVKVGTAVIVI